MPLGDRYRARRPKTASSSLRRAKSWTAHLLARRGHPLGEPNALPVTWARTSNCAVQIDGQQSRGDGFYGRLSSRDTTGNTSKLRPGRAPNRTRARLAEVGLIALQVTERCLTTYTSRGESVIGCIEMYRRRNHGVSHREHFQARPRHAKTRNEGAGAPLPHTTRTPSTAKDSCTGVQAEHGASGTPPPAPPSQRLSLPSACSGAPACP